MPGTSTMSMLSTYYTELCKEGYCESTWGVNDEEAGHLHFKLLALPEGLRPVGDGLPRHVGSADLLCDTPSLPLLHTGAPHIVEKLCFACRRRML